jgi:hypothetical protein
VQHLGVEGQVDVLDDGGIGLVGVELLLVLFILCLGHGGRRSSGGLVVVRVDDHDGVVCAIDLLGLGLLLGCRGSLLERASAAPEDADARLVAIEENGGAVGGFGRVDGRIEDAPGQLVPGRGS